MNYNELLKTSIWYEKILKEINIPSFNDDYHHLQYRWLNPRYPEFCKWILENFPDNLEWTEKLYWFVNGLIEKPKCIMCGKPTKFKSFYLGYSPHCSLKCSTNNPDILEKTKNTWMGIWETDNPSKSQIIKNKKKATHAKNKNKQPEQLIFPDLSKLTRWQRQSQYMRCHYLKFYEWINENYPLGRSWMERLYLYAHGVTEPPLCVVCGEEYATFKNFNEGHYKYCGTKCKQNDPGILEKVKNTLNSHFGEDAYKIRAKKGHETLSKKSVEEKEEIIQRTVKTKRENFIKKHEDIIGYTDKGEQIRSCPHPEKCIEEMCKTCDRTYTTKSYLYGNRKNHGYELCTKLNPSDRSRQTPIISRPSIFEKKCKELIKLIGIKHIPNVRSITHNKKGTSTELDIYIESIKTAIECNGSYYHSIKNPTTYKEQHMEKQQDCYRQGIEMITTWEDWDFEDIFYFFIDKFAGRVLTRYKEKWFSDLKENEWPLDLGWPPKGRKILKIIEHHCIHKDPYSKKEKFFECYDSGIAILT